MAVTDSKGVDRTKSEASASIARTGEDAATLRRRMERPARLGRYVLVMLGAVTGVAGFAFWFTGGSSAGLAIGAFGAVLIVLGVVQHVLHRRDLEHWPNDILLWDEGIELVLANGEVRGATWSDSDLAFQLVSRRAAPPTGREYLLIWLPDSKIPPAQLSAEGFDRLAEIAASSGLRISQTRRGSRSDATQVIQVQSEEAAHMADLGKTVGANG